MLESQLFRSAVARALGPGNRIAEKLEFRVPSADQMLAHSLAHHGDAAIALSQYFNISIQQYNCFRQIAETAFERPPEKLRILDFACGYGRLLRFLAAWLPGQNLLGAEIQADALDTNKRLFGIEGHLSCSDPEAFSIDRRFDMIWVASLFSHLPDRLFRAWLGKLHSLLAPGGVLCFSVRDESQFAGKMPANGFVYRPESEQIPIDASIYGTAWASEGYVRTTIESSVSGSVDCERIPRALAMEQDLYLLHERDRQPPVRIDRFRRGPWGWVDRIRRSRDGRIGIEGWAGSMDEAELDRVEVRLDGNLECILPGIPRPDVVEAFGDPTLARSGFAFDAQLSNPAAAGFVEVFAVGGHDDAETALLFAGPTTNHGNGHQ